MWKEENHYTHVYGSLDIDDPSLVEGKVYVH